MIIFRFRICCLSMALVVGTGCAVVPTSCEIFSPIDGVTPNSEMTLFPDQIVDSASQLKAKVSADSSLVGLYGALAQQIAGTDAYAAATEIAHLKRLIAFQRALEQANNNGGKPLLQPTDDEACEMLADSVASLDQGQSSQQFLDNLEQVRTYFGEEYPYRSESLEQ